MAAIAKNGKKDVAKGKEYLSICPECIIRLLEEPHLYHIEKDELYEINNEALEFLAQCDGIHRLDQLKPEPDFLDFCLEEGILSLHPELQISTQPKPREPVPLLSPSLRYLDLQITTRSNIQHYPHRRRLNPHCIQDMSPTTIRQVLTEFDRLQGLKVLICGGEPLLHPNIEEILELLSKINLRKILQTNGILVTPQTIPILKGIQEIQISLDGMKKGHEHFQGKGTFDQALDAVHLCRSEGFEVSITTLLHRENLDEIKQLSPLLLDLGVREWGINVLQDNKAGAKGRFLGLTPEQIAPCLKFAFGESFHGGTEGFTCGHHQCAIMPDGSVCKCGYYAERPVGHIREGLGRCWARLTHIPLTHLSCNSCVYLQECGGGCRKRAETELGPDPIMCAFYQQKSTPKNKTLEK